MAAFWIAEPAHVLIIAPNDQFRFAPIVRRLSHTAFMDRIGGRRKFNAAIRVGAIRVCDHLRYDRTATELLTDERDELDRTRLAVSPALPFALLWTLGECGHVQLAMRRMFMNRDDAEQATADVVRMLERLGRDTGRLIMNQRIGERHR